MTERVKQLVIVRGGNGTAIDTIHRLYHCGYPILVLESGYPLAVRRCAAFPEAVYDGTSEVEGITCIKTSDYEEACAIMEQGAVPVMIDESRTVFERMRPWALVDAILAKKNLGTIRDVTDKTIGFRPGFTAGQDVGLMIETVRGHNLGHIIRNGSAVPNTGIPGVIGGYGAERVIHTLTKGIFFGKTLIGNMVEQGQAIGVVVTGQGEVTVEASLTGSLRGIIEGGYSVVKGFEIADIGPEKSEYENCFIISDEARCIAGSVVEGLQILEAKQGY